MGLRGHQGQWGVRAAMGTSAVWRVRTGIEGRKGTGGGKDASPAVREEMLVGEGGVVHLLHVLLDPFHERPKAERLRGVLLAGVELQEAQEQARSRPRMPSCFVNERTFSGKRGVGRGGPAREAPCWDP